ncbi:MAG: TIGR00266 family protein [Erysipelotrichaceae bacterium]|nr:TIGR00266 family protein [Erysipelotrichaceae bacterium]
MKYEIFGGHFPAVTVYLDRGEKIFTQTGGLAWMSDRVAMDTNMKGGFLAGLGRLFSGDSLFIANYTAETDDQFVTLSASMPGEIRAMEIDYAHEYIAQKGAFLGATEGVEIEMITPDSFFAGLFGGEGFFLQHLHGDGLIFVELDGSIREYDLAPGETIKVDSGNVAMFEKRVQYDIESVKGFKNVLFGGEGLFLTTLTGPGKVWLQTMTAKDLAGRLIPFLPQPTTTTIETK